MCLVSQVVRSEFAGIRNQGNTCYLNSVLQSIFHVRAFRDELINAKHPEKRRRFFWQQKEVNVENALASVFETLARNATAGTRALTRSLDVDPQEQQDAQEYLRLVLEAIGSEMAAVYYRGQSERYIRVTDEEHAKMLIDSQYEGGKLETRRSEAFYDLSLDIKHDPTKLQYLKETIRELTRPQRLDGDAQWKTKDYGKRDADMGLDFISFPPVLVLHLKRFAFDFMRGYVSKVNAPLAFPLNELDLSDLLQKDNLHTGPAPIYQLHAVVCHLGTTGESGHYYALVDPLCDGRWLRFDDHRVTPVTIKDVINEGLGGDGALGSAYLLQYVRKDSLPLLRGERNGEESPSLDQKKNMQKEQSHLSSSFAPPPAPAGG